MAKNGKKMVKNGKNSQKWSKIVKKCQNVQALN